MWNSPTCDCHNYHRGVIDPMYMGIVQVGQQIGNRHSIRNLSSRKGTYGQNIEVLINESRKS